MLNVRRTKTEGQPNACIKKVTSTETSAHHHLAVVYTISLGTHVTTHSHIIAVPHPNTRTHNYALNRSWIQWPLTLLLSHSLAHLFMHSITHTFSHARTQPLGHLFMHSITHTFSHARTQLLAHLFMHWIIDTLTRSVTLSAILCHCTFTHSLTLTPIFSYFPSNEHWGVKCPDNFRPTRSQYALTVQRLFLCWETTNSDVTLRKIRWPQKAALKAFPL
jgi:hypothetical protein